jgi:hypothetical protein
MATDWMIPTLTGSIGVVGTLTGVWLNSLLTRRADRKRVRIEDDRRWLADKKRVYVEFLNLADSMIYQVSNITLGYYDPNTGESIEASEETQRGLDEFMDRVNKQLDPILAELRLISTDKVSELAERISETLLLAWEDVAYDCGQDSYKPIRELLDATRVAMRLELGLPDFIASDPT